MKKHETFLLRLISFILVCFIIVYMGYHVATVFRNPVQTVSAVMFTVEDIVPVNGFFVRDEMVIPYPDGVSPDRVISESKVSNGERVARDDVIFLLYDDPSALSAAAALESLERRISDMKYAQGRTSGSMDAVHMDLLIYQRLADMLDKRDRRRNQGMENDALEFKSLVFRREYTYGQGEDLSAVLFELEERADALRAGRQGAVSSVSAQSPGTFTTQLDGYESVLTPESLEELTVSDFLALGDKRAGSYAGMGKLALGFEWYHVILLPEQDAKRLAVGQSMTLRFSYEGQSEVKFKVARVSHPEGGQAVVVLSTTSNVGAYIDVRRMPADLVVNTFSGLRVPRNAIWVEGEEQQVGVYCLTGNQLVFKQVTIITERDNYYLVEFDPLNAKSGDLLPGDEMVTEGKDLYDRKVFSQ